MSLRNVSRIAAGAQASQSAPDVNSKLVQVKGVPPLDNSGLSVFLLNKAYLHFLTGSDQAINLHHLFAATRKICILPGLDLPAQFFCLPPQVTNRFL
jgi:hypothetical protein